MKLKIYSLALVAVVGFATLQLGHAGKGAGSIGCGGAEALCEGFYPELAGVGDYTGIGTACGTNYFTEESCGGDAVGGEIPE